MTVIVNRTRERRSRWAANQRQLVVLRRSPQYPTTRVEQFLLMATVVIMPLEDHIPAVAGYSVLFLLFGVLTGYVFLNRSRELSRTWIHPVFLAGYVLLISAVFIESSHPYSSYFEILRVGQMIAGAILVASLCRDKRALRTCMYGYLVAGLWLSVFLFLTTYGALQGTTATDFAEASRIRAEVFGEPLLQVNLNRMAFFTAQGAVVALVLALTTHSSLYRNGLFGATSVCLVASFLPLSRSGIVIVVVSCATVTFAYGITHGGKYFNRFVRAILLAIGLGACILMWVPDAVFSRLTFSTQQTEEGKMEGRAKVYKAGIEHLPEYVLTGVGAGNYWGPWGRRSKFAGEHGVSGTHNGFIQVTIYWGLAGCLALAGILYQAYRCLPARCGADPLSLGLVGVSVALLLYLMVTHVLAFKGFSLGLGMLVGARLWIWPQGVVQSTSQLRVRLHPTREEN